MKFNVAAIKAALKEAGHVVTDAEHLVASDLEQLYDYSMRHFGLKKQAVAYGLQYPSLLPKNFPGHPDAGEVVPPAAGSLPAATLPTGTDEPAPKVQGGTVVETPAQVNETAPQGTSEPAAPGTPAVVAEAPAAETEAPAPAAPAAASETAAPQA